MRELGWEKILYEKEFYLFCKDFMITPVFIKVEHINKEIQRIKFREKHRIDKNHIKFGLVMD